MIDQTKAPQISLENHVGGIFKLHVEIDSGTFPAGTTAAMKIYGPDGVTVLATWSGVYSPTAFDFTASVAAKATFPAHVPYRAYVTFPDVADPFLWFFGTLRRVG